MKWLDYLQHAWQDSGILKAGGEIERMFKVNAFYPKGQSNSVKSGDIICVVFSFFSFLIHIDFSSPVPFPKSYRDRLSLFIIQSLIMCYSPCK